MWVKKVQRLPSPSQRANLPAAVSEITARTWCQALLSLADGSPPPSAIWEKNTLHESLCQALAVMPDFIQRWWLRASPFGKSTAIWRMGYLGRGILGFWPEAPVLVVMPAPGGRSHHQLQHIPVPTQLVVGRGEGPVRWAMPALACPLQEGSNVSEALEQILAIRAGQGLCRLSKSSPKAVVRCRRLTGGEKNHCLFQCKTYRVSNKTKGPGEARR